MFGNDPDEPWSRLLSRLRERRDEIIAGLIAGNSDPSQYQNACGRIAEIEATIELTSQVRRGEDRRPSSVKEIRTVED